MKRFIKVFAAAIIIAGIFAGFETYLSLHKIFAGSIKPYLNSDTGTVDNSSGYKAETNITVRSDIFDLFKKLDFADQLLLLSAAEKLSDNDREKIMEIFNKGVSEDNINTIKSIFEESIGREKTEQVFSVVEKVYSP